MWLSVTRKPVEREPYHRQPGRFVLPHPATWLHSAEQTKQYGRDLAPFKSAEPRRMA